MTPKIAPSTFPPQSPKLIEPALIHQPNMSRRRIDNIPMQRKKSAASDDFGDADIDDDALCKATCSDLDFEHIDNFATPVDLITRNNTVRNKSDKEGQAKMPILVAGDDNEGAAPPQLPNGRWACSHRCKDKEACKHYCCKHGMDKPPKKTALKVVSIDEHRGQPLSKGPVQRNSIDQKKLQVQASKRRSCAAVEELDLTNQEKKRKTEYSISGPRDYKDLHNLHRNVQETSVPSCLHSVMHKKPAYCYGEGGEHQLSFLSPPIIASPRTSSEYGDLQLDEFAPEPVATQSQPAYSDELASSYSPTQTPIASRKIEKFGENDSNFGSTATGLTDLRDLQNTCMMGTSHMRSQNVQPTSNAVYEFLDVDFPVDIDFNVEKNANLETPKQAPLKPALRSPQIPPLKPHALISEPRGGFKQRFRIFQNGRAQGLQRDKSVTAQLFPASKDTMEKDGALIDQLDLFDNSPSAKVEGIEQKTNKHGTSAQPVKVVEKEQRQVPEVMKDLQPWLFQEFGDIVELVDE